MPPSRTENTKPSSRKKTKQIQAGISRESQIPSPPDWPALRPLIPPEDLACHVVVPGQIITIPNFWTSSLSKNYVSYLSGLPLVTTPGRPKKGEAVRVNDRFQVNDPSFADRLWNQTALRELVTRPDVATSEDERDQLWGGKVIGLNPNIRVYRYTKGQFFAQHYDDSNNILIPGDPAVPARTTWTLLLYLSSPATGCLGGETVFYPDWNGQKGVGLKNKPLDPVVIDLQVGMALLHKHGADCLLHEGKEVQQGEKWVIRTDLCVGR